MNDYLRQVYAFNLSYCEALLKDIPESEMRAQPSPGINPPAWLMGHLAICTDFTLELMGGMKQLPEKWHKEFGPQSLPLSKEFPYPTKDELWHAYSAGHADVTALSTEVPTDLLEHPNPLPFEFLKMLLPTTGDLIAHLMSTHEASHLGHLSNWRRQMGHPPLF